jgi:hypothetical protein
MRTHKHYGTPQDNSFIGDIVRCIAEHGGLRDWEKDLLINRITAPIDEPESPEVLRAKEGILQPAAHEPADMPTPNGATSASVARTPDTTEPLTMSITRDDDGHMCIAISDRKWKIMRHGIIGNGAADREEFHQAASDLVDNDLPFSDAGLESVVLSSQLLEMKDQSRAYRDAMRYRSAITKSLGEVMYGAYCDSLPSSEPKQPAWEDVVYKYSWETAATAAYLSIGLQPSEINKELQIVAARKRMQLLRSPFLTSGDIDSAAAKITAIAGPPPDINA